jgi:hypothetical protein
MVIKPVEQALPLDFWCVTQARTSSWTGAIGGQGERARRTYPAPPNPGPPIHLNDAQMAT